MTDWNDIGAIDDYPDSAPAVCELNNGDSIIVWRVAESVQAYDNICPHQGRSLEYAPGKVLLGKQGDLICASHGATFRPDTGLCTGGPCQGSSLSAMQVRVQEGRVLVRTSS